MNKKLISTLLSLAMVVATLPMTMLTASATVDEVVVSRNKNVVVVGDDTNSATKGPNIVNGLRAKGGMYDWIQLASDSKYGYIDLGKSHTITKIITIRRSSPEGCGKMSYYATDSLLTAAPSAGATGVTFLGELEDNVTGELPQGKRDVEPVTITLQQPVTGRYVYFDSNASEGIYEIEVYAVPDPKPQDLLYGKIGIKNDGTEVTNYTDHTTASIGTHLDYGQWVRYDLGFEADLRYLYCHATSDGYHRAGFGVKAGNTTNYDEATVLLEPSPDYNEARLCGNRIEISGKYRYIWLYSGWNRAHSCYLDDVRVYGVDDRQYVLGDWSFTEANGEYLASIDVEYINSTSQSFSVQMINYDEEGNMIGNPTENVFMRTDNPDGDTMTGTITSSIMADRTQVVLFDEESRLVSMYNKSHTDSWDGFNENKGTADSFEESVSMATSAEYPFDDVSVTISGEAVESDDLIMISATVEPEISTFASQEIDGYYYIAYAVANNGYSFNIPLNVAGEYAINVVRIPADVQGEIETKDFTYTLIEPEEIKAAINAFFPENADEADFAGAIDNAIDEVGIIGEVDIIDRDIIYNTDFAEVAVEIAQIFKTVDGDGNVEMNTDELIDAVNTMIVVYKLRDGDSSVMEEYGEYITENDQVKEWVNENLQYSLTATVIPQSNMQNLTNIGQAGVIKFEFSDDMDTESLIADNIVVKKGEDVVPYDMAKVTEEEFWIDLGSLDASSEYTVTFTSGIKTVLQKKMLEEKVFEFTTGNVAKVPYKEGKILKNIALNKPVINLSEVQTLGGDGTTANVLFDGDTTGAYASYNSIKSATPIVDLGCDYIPAAIRLWGRSTQWYYHYEDIEFIGVSKGTDVPTSADINAGEGVMFHKIEKVTSSNDDTRYGDAKLHHGKYVAVRNAQALEEYGPIRYLAVKANQDIYVKEIEIYAYVDVEISDIEVNNSAVSSGSSHTFSVDITENTTTGNTYYMLLNAYDEKGHTTAKTVKQVNVSDSAATITATEDTVGITAMMVDDLTTMNLVTYPLTIGTPQSGTDALGAGVQIKGNTSQIQMSANTDANVSENMNVSVIVVNESATNGGDAADVFASLTKQQLENGIVFAATMTAKDAKTYTISELETGKYYVQMVASNADASKRVVKYYKQAIVDDDTRDEIILDIISAEGEELQDALIEAIYTDEIISLDAIYDSANLRAKLESENIVDELGYTKFTELLGYTKDMISSESSGDVTTQDIIDIVNAAQVVYALYMSETDEAIELMGTYASSLGECYLAEADKTKTANIFAMLKDNIDDAESLADTITWSGLLAFMDGATDAAAADAMEKYDDLYGIDLDYASGKKVSLTRAANFIERGDVTKLYGKTAFNSAYKTAVDKARAAAMSGVKQEDNMTGGAGYAPSNNRGGGGGGGGGSSTPEATPPVQTPAPAGKPSASGFADMQSYAWADEAVADLVNAGVIDGNGNGEFEPSRNVTRAEFVKMLVVASKIKVAEGEGMHFIDVPNGSWQYPYIKIAFSRKICNGIDDYHFNPNGTITRQDMAVMLSNMISYLGLETDGEEKAFADSASVANYAVAAIADATKAGLINGFEDGSFRPTENTRRVDAAMVISKLMNMIG